MVYIGNKPFLFSLRKGKGWGNSKDFTSFLSPPGFRRGECRPENKNSECSFRCLKN